MTWFTLQTAFSSKIGTGAILKNIQLLKKLSSKIFCPQGRKSLPQNHRRNMNKFMVSKIVMNHRSIVI